MSATSLTLEHAENGRWRITVWRGPRQTFTLTNAEAELLWVMLGESRGEGTFSRTVTFGDPDRLSGGDTS